MIALLLCFLTSPSTPSLPAYNARKVIAYAKTVDVARFDPALPSMSLDSWLRTGEPHVDSVQWEIRNCCNCDRSDARLCVRFVFAKGSTQGNGMLRVGTVRKGVTGPPRLEGVNVDPYPVTGVKLSEVPSLLSRNAEIIRYAKSLDVHELDPKLPSEELEHWLRNGPAQVQDLTWRLNGCDRKDDPAHSLCVRFGFLRSGVGGWGSIKIGTLENGVSGTPRFEYAAANTSNVPPIGQMVSTLSGVPHLIDEVSSLAASTRPR